MHPPAQLVQWIEQRYPKPSVDKNWLQQCYAWVVGEHNLNPVTDLSKIKEHVESQLLMSDLTDSMVHGSGLPYGLSNLQKGTLSGPPVLVQITALTEIGHSAFSLMNVRQAKIDRADLSGLSQGDNEDEADEGPIPNYPRSMLHFELSDGAIGLKAIEYRKIPQLDLENTPLGYKNVTIRHGIAFLEPKNVILKGYNAEDLEANRDRDFLRGLRSRLDPNAQHEPDGHGGKDGGEPPPAPVPAPVTATALRNAPAPMSVDVAPLTYRTVQSRVAASARPNQPARVPGHVARSPSPPMVNNQPSRARSLVNHDPRPGPSASSGNPALTTSPHFSTPGPNMVSHMRLSPTRASTTPLADELGEPGSDWYYTQDDIDPGFFSGGASELERSEALLPQPSQQPFLPPSQAEREVIFVDDKDNDKENASVGPGFVRRTIERQMGVDGAVIDLSAEVTEGPRIRPSRVDDDSDVISIGSDD